MPVYLDAVGTIKALNTVTVRPQVDGKLLSVDFKEGEDVKKGDVLARIDPTTYQAQLDQAIAKKAQDEALLANAKVDLDRYEKLAATNAINHQQADTQRALVAQYAALVQSDQAAIENAQATLDYTTIVAPIDGRTGIRQVDEGNIVHASELAGDRRHHPDQADLGDLQPAAAGHRPGQRGLRQGAAPGRGAAPRQQRGDRPRHVDAWSTTRSTRPPAPSSSRPSFPTRTSQLWPGQFVNVRLLIDTLEGVVVIPTGAVQRGPNGTFVYVVKDDNTAAMRPIVVQKQDETQTVVKSGLARRPSAWSPPASSGSPTAARSTIGSADGAPAAAGARRAATQRPALRRREADIRSNERFLPIHPPADRHLLAWHRGDAGWRARLLVAAGVGAAAGGFPHHPGHHPVAGRQPRYHRLAGDRAAWSGSSARSRHCR